MNEYYEEDRIERNLDDAEHYYSQVASILGKPHGQNIQIENIVKELLNIKERLIKQERKMASYEYALNALGKAPQ